MDDKEFLKFGVIRDVCEKRSRHADAARVLSLSVHQVQRLVARFRQHGAAAIVHQRRVQSSSD
ncbi:helix-turn-helix domain-containing protein [Photobacterium sp. TLY01]|uniref:helix-turn-helix domain-containing protein n=1 Tax=Photobacterium sp. TLY01 TaxID=2907534 RepID=UPI00351CDC36